MKKMPLSFLLMACCPIFLIALPYLSKFPNLEAPRGGRPRPPILVPQDATNLLSLGCAVTSSTLMTTWGSLSYITDGEKECDINVSSLVRLAGGLQWVQIDLGMPQDVYAICIWRYHKLWRIYRDVIVQLSNDPEFIDNVTTVFNNDHDNSARQGEGQDKEYIETNEGRPIPVNAVRARYIRVYCNGSYGNGGFYNEDVNGYTEIEVFGRRNTESRKAPSSKTIPLRIEYPKPQFT